MVIKILAAISIVLGIIALVRNEREWRIYKRQYDELIKRQKDRRHFDKAADELLKKHGL